MDRNTDTPVVAIIALIVGAIALLFAWIAYNRAGIDIEDEVRNEVSPLESGASNGDDDRTTGGESASEVEDLETAYARAYAELENLEARAEAGEDPLDSIQELNQIEADLTEAYQAAGLEVGGELDEIRDGFETVEEMLRSGTGDVLGAIGNLMLLLEEEVRPSSGATSTN